MNPLHQMRRAAALVMGFVLLLSSCSFAQERLGPIREFLKDKRAANEQPQSPPANTQDATARIDKPGDYRFAIEHGGISRTYLIHVPPSYNAARPTPLLFSFHGGGAFMDYQASDENYGQISKSNKEGFIVVFPNGYSRQASGRFATWNAGSCCAAARDENIDDVGFVRQMVSNVSGQLNIDMGRIFATGMSNGGMFAYRLACEMSDTFKAVASVAGPDGMDKCNPKNPVSTLHIHARNDDHAQFEGGRGKGSRSRSTVTEFTSVPETVSRWVGRNQCKATPIRTLDKPGAFCEVYSECRGGVRVQLCVTETGKHSWPGASRTRGDEPASTAISANDVMWDFFMGR